MVHAQRNSYGVEMAQIFKVVAEWQGFQGAPGYTNLFFRNIISDGAPGTLDERASAILAQGRVFNFFQDIMTFFPDDVKIQVQANVDVLEDTDGALVGNWQGDPLAQLQGENAGGYAAASGACVSWQTSVIRNRRRIRGRTFLVPLRSDSYLTTGRIGPGTATAIQTAANELVDPAGLNTFGIWARPSSKGATDGVWAPAKSGRMTDLPAVLRSRRD